MDFWWGFGIGAVSALLVACLAFLVFLTEMFNPRH